MCFLPSFSIRLRISRIWFRIQSHRGFIQNQECPDLRSGPVRSPPAAVPFERCLISLPLTSVSFTCSQIFAIMLFRFSFPCTFFRRYMNFRVLLHRHIHIQRRQLRQITDVSFRFQRAFEQIQPLMRICSKSRKIPPVKHIHGGGLSRSPLGPRKASTSLPLRKK